MGTASTRAATDPEVRDILRETLAGHDRAFEARFRQAQAVGELDPAADPVRLALLASATLQSLAVRSRTGESRVVLDTLADAAVDLICGPPIRG
ncbi:TetR family transcriptional regulator C-terminal domain-containing protein [Roseomonas sp. CCTCC AB2023176]|uniref:TetR family transcriptional regulator C-terminal domain-containing protein n=1 Tax=Roseomonas sp. CCTCC AB2023176 TaxID=3342640 RepID=UPI0035D883D6